MPDRYPLILKYRIVSHPPETIYPVASAHFFSYEAQLQVNDHVHGSYGETEQEAKEQLCQLLMSQPNGPVYVDLLHSIKD